MINILRKIGGAVLGFAAMFATQSVQAQSVVCQNYNANITPNGVAVVTAQDLDGGSSVPNGYSLALMYNGAIQSAVTLTCNNYATPNNNPMYMVLALLNPNQQVVDTCGTTVYLLDSLNVCGTSGSGYTAVDTVIQDASSCNACDGMGYFYLVDAATGNVGNTAPYTATWSNGISQTTNTAMFGMGNLCPGTYTVNVVDGNGYQVTHTFVIGCNGGGTAPTALCNSSLSLDLGASNGYVVVTPQMLDAGSTGGYMYIIGGNSPVGGWNSAVTFGCSDLGQHTLALAVGNNSNTVATCSTTVVITDTMNICGGQSGYGYFVDSLNIPASDCNTCDGTYAFGYMLDANGNYVAATAIVWQDGVTGYYRNDLCPYMPYTYTVYDANQNAYTNTIVVGCNSGNPTGNNCIDPALIDSNAVCPAVYAPVCGCNGITYGNDCEAQAAGLLSWTTGPCNNNGNGNMVVTVTSQGTGCDTFSCTGYAMLSATNNNGTIGSYNYFWSDGFQGPVHQGLCAGIYTVDVTDANTNSFQMVTVVIGTAQGCVWPGDTDDNTTVNNFDILPIALAYGESGAIRANATIGWYGQSASDWNTANPLANMPNYKHIDCNGDGLIDLNDTQAISQNYGYSYFRSSSSNGTIPLFVGSTTTQEGQRIGLPINFGTATSVAQDIYGLAFTINYDPTMVVAGSIDIDFSGSWLGSDLLTFTKDFPAVGVIEVAVARKDRQNISNFGEIGTLNLTISDDILRSSSTQDMPLSISTVKVVDNANRAQGADTDTQTGVVTVELASGVTPIAEDFKVLVFPNPSRNVLNINTENTWIEDLELRNTTGQLLFQQNGMNTETASINVNELPSGVYLLSVKTAKGIQHQRITVLR